jgi:hypothetical protein
LWDASVLGARRLRPRLDLIGCLDEPTGIRLADHIYVAEKGDYYQIGDGVPQALES